MSMQHGETIYLEMQTTIIKIIGNQIKLLYLH